MVDSFPAALRLLREENGLSLRDLARRTYISFTHLSNIENGQRTATEEVAIKCDQALGSTPLLQVMLSVERGSPMLRRVLFGGTLGVAAGALLANADAAAALAAATDAAIRAHVGGDWDAIAGDFTRRYVGAGAQYGPELAAQIMVAHQRAIDGDTDAARCAAQLTLLYGLWVGDAGKISVANSLYATATALADTTTDRSLQAWVRARAASRGPYEGWTVARVESAARRALALADSGRAAIEARSAMVHLYALTGRIESGRAEIRAMYAAVADDTDRLRVMVFDNYLECRAGTLTDAHAAYERTRTLAAVPVYGQEATVYLGRAMVAAGDVTGGVQVALDAVRTCRTPTRILGLGVADVLAAVPPGVRLEPVAALRGYASPGPAPWETIR